MQIIKRLSDAGHLYIDVIADSFSDAINMFSNEEKLLLLHYVNGETDQTLCGYTILSGVDLIENGFYRVMLKKDTNGVDDTIALYELMEILNDET